MTTGNPMTRVPLGVPLLDSSIEGGLPANRVTLVTGGTGAGKTTLALQFLAEGLRTGDPGIFVAVDQKPAHVSEMAAAYGWAVDVPGETSITMLDGSPALSLMRNGQRSVDARAVMSDLIPHLRATGARRLVIDSLSALVPPDLSESAEADFLRDLFFALEDNIACTSLLVCPDGDGATARIGALASRLATGVIDLRRHESGGAVRRCVLVTKMRATKVDPVEQEFVIGQSGVVMNQV